MGIIVFFLIICSTIIIGSIIYSVYKKHRFSIYFSHIAQEYGIIFTKGSTFGFPSVSGLINSYPVHIKRHSFSSGNSKVQTLKFEIDIRKGKLHPFSISAEGFVSQIKKIFGKGDIQIGDEYFDNRALIQGYDTSQLFVLLNYKARSLIYDFLSSAYREKFIVNEKRIEYYVSFWDIRTEEDMIVIIEDILSLAKIFCRKGKPVDLLKKNYITERDDNVKKKLLNTLLSVAGSLPSDDPVIKKALKHKDFEIQFLGARLLKKEGYEYLKLLYKYGGDYIKKLIINSFKKEKEACFLNYFLKKATVETSIEIKKELVEYFRAIGDVKAEPLLRNEINKKQDFVESSDFLSY